MKRISCILNEQQSFIDRQDKHHDGNRSMNEGLLDFFKKDKKDEPEKSSPWSLFSVFGTMLGFNAFGDNGESEASKARKQAAKDKIEQSKKHRAELRGKLDKLKAESIKAQSAYERNQDDLIQKQKLAAIDSEIESIKFQQKLYSKQDSIASPETREKIVNAIRKQGNNLAEDERSDYESAMDVVTLLSTNPDGTTTSDDQMKEALEKLKKENPEALKAFTATCAKHGHPIESSVDNLSVDDVKAFAKEVSGAPSNNVEDIETKINQQQDAINKIDEFINKRNECNKRIKEAEDAINGGSVEWPKNAGADKIDSIELKDPNEVFTAIQQAWPESADGKSKLSVNDVLDNKENFQEYKKKLVKAGVNVDDAKLKALIKKACPTDENGNLNPPTMAESAPKGFDSEYDDKIKPELEKKIAEAKKHFAEQKEDLKKAKDALESLKNEEAYKTLSEMSDEGLEDFRSKLQKDKKELESQKEAVQVSIEMAKSRYKDAEEGLESDKGRLSDPEFKTKVDQKSTHLNTGEIIKIDYKDGKPAKAQRGIYVKNKDGETEFIPRPDEADESQEGLDKWNDTIKKHIVAGTIANYENEPPKVMAKTEDKDGEKKTTYYYKDKDGNEHEVDRDMAIEMQAAHRRYGLFKSVNSKKKELDSAIKAAKERKNKNEPAKDGDEDLLKMADDADEIKKERTQPDDVKKGFEIKSKSKDGKSKYTYYRGDDGNFYMKSNDEDDQEPIKLDFDKWLEEVEDNTDFDFSTDDWEDVEDNEGVDDEETGEDSESEDSESKDDLTDKDENGKIVHPKKVWKRRKKKNGMGVTKRYYNVKDRTQSISQKELQERIKHYNARKKKKESDNEPKESLKSFIKNAIFESASPMHTLSGYIKIKTV